MDKAPEHDTIETLYPLVRVFKEKLTAVEWAELELGAFEKTIEAVVKHCCMQIVVTAVKYRDCIVCKEPDDDLPTHLSQTYSGCNGFQNLTLSEQKVLKCLGDSISLNNTEIKVVLEAIWDSDKEVVIEFLMKEITHVVTFELLQSLRGRNGNSGGEERSKPFDTLCLTIMLDKNLDFLVEMLQRHTAWISCLPTLQDGPVCEMSDTEQDTPEMPETPVTPVTPEKEISSLMGSTTVKVAKILEKVASSVNVIDSEANITLEEYNRTLQLIFRDTQSVASEIVQLMLENKSDQDISESEVQSLHRGKEAQSEISALLIRSFTKMSVINLVTKLRGKHDRLLSTEGHQSLLRLLDGVDLLVDKMVLLDEDHKTKKEVGECYYGRAARRICVERQKLIRKRLCALTFRHLNPDKGKVVCSRQEIQVEVNACIEEIAKWLNHQAKQHGNKSGITKDTLEEIHRELATLVPTAEKPLTKERAKPEINACPTSSPSDVSDEDEYEPTAKADPILDGLCTFVVTQLVKKILGNYYFHPSEASAIAQTLKEMLLAELAGFEIVVELNNSNTKKIIKAVERELLRRMGSSGLVKQAMWAKREWVFQCIVEHLKMLLLTPLQTSRFLIFLDVYFKPLSLCFRSCSSRSMIGNREQRLCAAHMFY